MQCRKCGNHLTKEDYFCPECGAKVEKEKSNNTYKVLFWIVLVLLVITFFSGNDCEYSSNNECNELRSEYNSLLNQYNQLNQQKQLSSLEPPYINIYNRTVMITFRKTDNTIHSWTVPFSSLESDIQRGQYRRKFMPEVFIPMVNQMYGSYLPLCAFSDCSDFIENYKETMSELQENSLQYINLRRDDGSSHLVMDFRPFIDSETFKDVIRTLYQESKSDEYFIREVWNIVTQLNIYSSDIEETPRYPLETFLAGGGDCEDSSILLASMIKSAPTNWDVQLVYMDADNPDNPQEVNHVLVFVDTGKEEYFIETTNNQEMQPYDYIDGWYLEI